MQLYEIILIGIVLAIDAFALTVANCTTYKKTLTKIKEWSMPTAFGVFQFLMPVIGFFITSIFNSGIPEYVGKYITAGIFFILSIKIVFDNVREIKSTDCENCETPKSSVQKFTVWVLMLQAIATSIDALAIGVSFNLGSLWLSIWLSSLVIGLITFMLVTIALYFGKYIGKLLGKYAEWAGAIILFALSVKNFIEAIVG